MNKPKLIITIGNIASGKSTWVKHFIEKDSSVEDDYVIISKDAIRRMLGGGKYIYVQIYEPIIHSTFISCVCNFMAHNINIVIDDNNVERVYRNHLFNLTTKRTSVGYDYEIIAAIMPKIPLSEALKRRALQEGIHMKATNKIHWTNIWHYFNNLYEPATLEEGFDEIWRL